MSDSVMSFANDLKMPVAALIKQLHAAGCAPKTPTSLLSGADKNKLLEWLRGKPAIAPKGKYDSVISRLVDAGYINKKLGKIYSKIEDITDEGTISELAKQAVLSAYSNSTISKAQILIELLPQNLQESLARWFKLQGIHCIRQPPFEEFLLNSLWTVPLPLTRKVQAKIFAAMDGTPVHLEPITPQFTVIRSRPDYDYREKEEMGHSVRALRGGATGLKR